MTTFIRDDLALPDGKSDSRPLDGPAAKNYTAAEWNLLCSYLDNVRDELQALPGYVNVKRLGAVGDGVTDDWSVFNDAIEALDLDNSQATTIYIPPGTYRLSRPLHVKRALHLRGAFGFTSAGSASKLKFDAGVHGVIVHRPTTSDDGGSGEGAIIECIGVTAASKSGRTHGVTLRAKATCRNVLVESMSGDGFHVVAASDWNTDDSNTEWAPSTAYAEGDIVKSTVDTKRYICLTAGTSASSGTGPTGTGTAISNGSCVWKYTSGAFANNWRIEDCRAASNSGHGLFVQGDNANAGYCSAFDATLSGEWGILENSFLANTYTACHTATNGTRAARNQVPVTVTAWAALTAYTVGQYVRNGGKGYYCRDAGTSAASGGPSGTGGDITDGTGGTAAHWSYTAIIWQSSAAYAVGAYVVNDSGKTYKAITAGTSAASGGPTGTAADITDGSVHWAYVAYPPGSYATNLTPVGAFDGNANAPNLFLNCYGEQDQAPGVGFSPSIFLGGLHANTIIGGRGSIAGSSLGGVGASLRVDATRFDLVDVNDSAYTPRHVIVGDQLGGGRYLTFAPSDGSANLVFQDQSIFNTKFSSFGVVSLPTYQGFGIGQQLNKIGTRRTPIGQLAVNHTYGLYLGTTRVTSLAALPADGVWGQGIFQNYYAGDVILNSAAAAGGTAGWVCTASGTTGTYTEGRTATTDGTATIVLNSATTVLDLGNYLTINGVPGYRLDSFGTTGGAEDRAKLVLNTVIAAAGPGLTVGYAAPTFAEFGKVSGGAGSSTGAPGAATLNTQKGRSAIAAGAASVTITNSRVSSTSIVTAVLQSVDATLTQILTVVPGSGSFVVTGNANATATTNIGWFIEE